MTHFLSLLMLPLITMLSYASESERPSDFNVSSNTLSLKAVLPHEILPDGQDSITAEDGTVIRKGTVKATMENIKLLNSLFKIPYNNERSLEVEKVANVMSTLIKSLHHIGLFDEPFTLEEWLQDPDNQGRIFITLQYFNMYSDRLNNRLMEKLVQMRANCQPEVMALIDQVLKK